MNVMFHTSGRLFRARRDLESNLAEKPLNLLAWKTCSASTDSRPSMVLLRALLVVPSLNLMMYLLGMSWAPRGWITGAASARGSRVARVMSCMMLREMLKFVRGDV